MLPSRRFFMSQHMYLAPGVEMMLLMMGFYVVMSVVSVITSPA